MSPAHVRFLPGYRRVTPYTPFDLIQEYALDPDVYALEFTIGGFVFPRELRLSSNLECFGGGLGTKIGLAPGANSDVFTNDDWSGAATNIHLANFFVDGNAAAQTSAVGDGPGQSGVSFVNLASSSASDMHIVDTFLHGVDMNRQDANGGPNATEPGCEDISISRVHTSGFGDDGITTHWSKAVRISDSTGRDPGRHYTVGGNAFEVDDGSEDVLLTNSHAFNCQVGFKSQGHGDVGQGVAGSPPPARRTTHVACSAHNSVDAAFMAISGGDAAGNGQHSYSHVYESCRSTGGRFGFWMAGVKRARIHSPDVQDATEAAILATGTFTLAVDIQVDSPMFVNNATEIIDPNGKVTVT